MTVGRLMVRSVAVSQRLSRQEYRLVCPNRPSFTLHYNARSCCRYYITPVPRRDHPADVLKLAVLANEARAGNYQLPRLLTEEDSTLDQAKAYRVASAIRMLRTDENADEIRGRKIGFTNRNIWPEYNIDASNWSYVYRSTISDIAELPSNNRGEPVADISDISNLDAKIEPEIIFGLKKAPRVAMTDLELIRCIDWVSHGFELVQSIFPGWKFTAVDTTAAFALHGQLLVGQRVPIGRLGSEESVLDTMKTFSVTLHRNGAKIDQGSGSNVLGSPLNALRHLCELLESDEWNLPLADGEIVTTGTLTRAWAIDDGSRWHTEVEGIALPGVEVEFHKTKHSA